MLGKLAAITVAFTVLAVPTAQAATTDTATAVASDGPYLVDTPITFTSTTPCTTACRLTWKYLSGTRLGDQLGEGVSVTTTFSTPGVKTVQLRLTEFCVGTSRLVCASEAYVSVVVGEPVPAPLDTTAPTFSASGLEAEATGPSTVVNYTFNATDPDDAVVGQVCSPEPGSSFPVGSTEVGCTAIDSNGNVGTAAFAVVVSDTTGPALSVPGPIEVEATSPAGAAVEFAVSATDVVDGSVAPSCSWLSGSTFPVGSTTVDCTVSDAHHNNSSASFAVVVSDTTGPALSVPGPIEVEATSPAGAAVEFAVSATDVVDGSVAPSCSWLSGSTFPVGSTTVDCTVADAHGNRSSASFDVLVVDTTAPTIDTAAAVASPGPYLVDVPITFTSTTACTRPCRLIWTHLNGTRLGDRIGEGVSVSQAFSTPGLKTVQLRLTEFCVGTSHLVCASQTLVSVLVEALPVPVDTTAPTFSASGLAAEATGPSTVVNYTFNATDPDDAVVGQSCSPGPGSSFPVGSTAVGCTAVDSNGNVGTAAFAVVVSDTTGPALSVPGPITVGAKSSRGASVTYTVSASDLVDGPVTPNCSMAAGAIFPVGWTTVDCTVADAHGNRSSASFGVLVTTGPALDGPPPAVIGVKVANGTAPTVSVPAPLVVNATSPAGAVVRYTVTATDSAGSPVVPVCSKPSGAVFPIGAPTVTCTATDSLGHTSPANTFVVHVKGARVQLTDLLARVLHSGLPGHAVADRVRGLIRSFAGRPARLDQTCRLLGAFDKELRRAQGVRLTTAQRGVLRRELARVANVVGCGKTR